MQGHGQAPLRQAGSTVPEHKDETFWGVLQKHMARRPDKGKIMAKAQTSQPYAGQVTDQLQEVVPDGYALPVWDSQANATVWSICTMLTVLESYLSPRLLARASAACCRRCSEEALVSCC